MSSENRLSHEELERNRELYREVREILIEQKKQIDKDCELPCARVLIL
jgi:hypothetical protein